MVTMDEVRAFATTLPRSYEAIVRGRVKFRIGRIVWLAFSKDGSTMGFAFPKEWRTALVEAEPEKFSLPSEHDMRYHWTHVRLDAIDEEEMRDLVEDAWAFCVPEERRRGIRGRTRLLARRRHGDYEEHHRDRPGPGEWFSGDGLHRPVAAPSAAGSRVGAAAVHFTPGARTAWHTHPTGRRSGSPKGLASASGAAGPSR